MYCKYSKYWQQQFPLSQAIHSHLHCWNLSALQWLVLTQINTWYCRGSRFFKWCGSEIPEQQKKRLFSKCLWRGVTVLSCCLPVSWLKKHLAELRAEEWRQGGEGLEPVKAGLIANDISNIVQLRINLSKQLHRYSHTLPVWWAWAQSCTQNLSAWTSVQRINWHSCTCSCYLRPCLCSWLVWPGTFSAVMSFGHYMFWEPQLHTATCSWDCQVNGQKE